MTELQAARIDLNYHREQYNWWRESLGNSNRFIADAKRYRLPLSDAKEIRARALVNTSKHRSCLIKAIKATEQALGLRR